MADIDGTSINGNHGGVVLDIKDAHPPSSSNLTKEDSDLYFSVPFMQKLVAEMVGTYFLIFAGCSSVAVNLNFEKVVTLPGISIVWGLAVMVLVYSLGHISGAHFNPAVTLAFATCKRFPWKQVPAYILCQVIGSTLAAGTIRLIFQGKQDQFTGTMPAGSDLQSFVVEFIITFYLMFIISGVATDNRAIGELAGLAVGSVRFHRAAQRDVCRANIRGVDESCKELGTCNGVTRIQRHMDLRSVAHPWSSGWCMGV
ncbi:hypothetical protein POTOM_039586 [Populus tomentosa]|uniref:Uncharacterized protein n=1 Tax=Populus tomentosa TaxID=118781 RepID=A0A8X7YS74_POPTO|nr:hypothetical protein POTOM_039586 [Populus tomentosa]